MFTVRLQCPHCGRDKDFQVTNLTHYISKEPLPNKAHTRQGAGGYNYAMTDKTRAYAVIACPECNGPVLLVYELMMDVLSNLLNAINDGKRIYDGPLPNLVRMYPEPKKPIVSEYYPGKVSKIFASVQKQFKDTADEMAAVNAVIACRSAMEVALKSLETQGSNVFEHINDAREKGLITQGLADWAHHLRLQGNEAVHELEANREEAQEMIEFLHLFLEITFVLPKRIEMKKHQGDNV